MILLGCLFAAGLAFVPRVMLVLAWLFSERWPIVWSGDWLVPLLGIVFLPYTTIMYLLAWSPTGISGWDWLWIVLGLFLDAMHYQQAARRPSFAGSLTTREPTTRHPAWPWSAFVCWTAVEHGLATGRKSKPRSVVGPEPARCAGR